MFLIKIQQQIETCLQLKTWSGQQLRHNNIQATSTVTTLSLTCYNCSYCWYCFQKQNDIEKHILQ